MSKIHDGNDTRGTLPAHGARHASAKREEAASPSEPFVLTDAIATSDAGQLLMIQYVDVGAASEEWERVVLVKGIEAEYSLAHSVTIRISSPHRFQDLGETLIRDEQEGRAQNRTEEFEKREYVAERREQEEALHQLGAADVRLGSHDSRNSQRHAESYTFGEGSWIFCTAIQPVSEDEWQSLHKNLPASYNDYTTIHQPRKFAHALGLMFIDQIGPNSTDGRFTHKSTATKPIVTLHDSLTVMHGPVLYTQNVYDFLSAHQDSALAKLYPLFVKDVEHKDQREYRFVIVGNDDLQRESRDIVVSGMMRDSLSPVRNSSAVRFESTSEDQGTAESISVTPKGYSKRMDQTRTKRERRTRTLSVDGEVRQLEEQTREVILSLTSESVVRGDVATEVTEEIERHTGSLVERASESVEVDGVPVETSKSETVRIGYIVDVEEADTLFGFEDKREAEEVIECVKNLGQRVLDSRVLRERISQLLELTLDPRRNRSMEVASAALHGICALVNLHTHFGDVVERVEIEEERYISIGLKPSTDSDANGKLLVGPLGTYAYVLRRGEESTNGFGGEESRLVLFPTEEDAERFAEYGWPAKEPEVEDE